MPFAVEAAGGDVLRVWVAGLGDPIEVPGLRGRCLAVLPIAGRDVMALAFGADTPGIGTQDLVALLGWDGARLRVLGVETLAWQRADGARFRMRLAATPDRQHLSLDCLAAMARPVTLPFRLTWHDWLGWQNGAPLADARPRAPLPGTWQAETGAVRARVAAWLAEPRISVTLDDLAGTGLLRQFGCMAAR